MVGLLGCGIYGLDLMKDSKGNFLFCEINQNPEFAHSWKVHKVDVAKKIADYAIASMEKRS